MSVLSFLKGSNVFVFDTETTGLPSGSPTGWGSYWDYRMNEKYNNCRIVSIAWSSINNFDRDNIQTSISIDSPNSPNSLITRISHYLRYPEGFTDVPTTHIHGISYEELLTKGMPLNVILSIYGLGKSLLEADYIVAHNAGFDYHVLMNELYRLSQKNKLCKPTVSIENNINNINNIHHNIHHNIAELCIIHLQDLKNGGRIICSGDLSVDICKLEFPIKTNTYLGNKKAKKYKMPKLCELYKHFYGKDFENAHSADGDVKALLEIMKMM